VAHKPKAIIELNIETSDEYDRGTDSDGSIGVIYGAEGTGKTTALRNLPAVSTLVIGFDSGTKVLKKMGYGHRVQKLRGDLANLDALFELITADESSPYWDTKKQLFPKGIKFVVIDHFTEMFKWIENAYADRRDHFTLTLKDRGDTSSSINRYIRMFRDLSDLGINVVFLALEELYEVGEKAGEGGSIKKLMPSSSVKVSKQLCGIADFVGRLVYDVSQDSRAIRMYGSVEESISCKSRCVNPEFNKFPHNEWEEPDILRIISKDLGYDPDKMVERIEKENEEERERLKGVQGQNTNFSVDLRNSDRVNTVTGSTNEPSRKSEKEVTI